MQSARLGRSALEVSRVGLGCNNFGWRLDSVATRAVVDAALDAGITFLDTADIYGGHGGSERFLGEALAGRRDRVVLATKFGMDMDGANGDAPRGSREYLRRALAGSLERLRSDRVDLYYYHRPDGVTPIAETVAAMSELVEEGTVRALGLSNVEAAQIREAAAVAEIAAVQNYYSLVHRDDDAEVLPLCRELGISYIPYFPLESGLLTGKYRRGEAPPQGTRLSDSSDRLTDERLVQVEQLEAFAAARDHTLLELAVGGLASIPGVASVIAGATSPAQARANAAAGSWELTAVELEAL